jgi:hypothetical protein
MFLHDSHCAHPATLMTVSMMTIKAHSFIMVTSDSKLSAGSALFEGL